MKFRTLDNMVCCDIETHDDPHKLTIEQAEELKNQLDVAINIIKTQNVKSLKELGEILLTRMIDMQKRLNGINEDEWTYFLCPICCKGHVTNDGTVKFWINTGRRTQIDGWMTQEEIEAFIKSDEKLVDQMKWD